LRLSFASPDLEPAVRRRPAPPLLIAGDGDRVLRLAAREADIVGFSGDSASRPGADPDHALASRVEYVRAAAGDRFAELELNLFISTVAIARSGEPNLMMARILAPHLSDEQLLRLPTVLAGSEQQIAETVLGLRENHAVTYLTVLEHDMDAFAGVIPLLCSSRSTESPERGM
jgi:alkanesulfonate monooxygenase SsuD/methylene tetrahydromethanopterin reductase-like flavin-dependent oxidoreductase (luciferase family)